MTNIDDKVFSQIKEMIEEGYSIPVISRKIFVKKEIIKQIIQDNNLKIKKENFDDLDRLLHLYKDGVSAKNLGIKFSMGKRRVMNFAKDHNITVRSQGEANRINKFNENIFDNINTDEKAYWLGFLYAAGYNSKKVSSVRLFLSEKSADHIKKYCVFMGYDFGMMQTITDGKNNTVGIIIYSKHLCEILERKGCPEAKSLILKFPNWLDKKLIFHFIRGYFDGNGRIAFNSKQREWVWSITGTKEFCSTVKDIFSYYDLNTKLSYISKSDKNIYLLKSFGNLKNGKICDLLYNNATIFLQRKYDKYCILKQFNASRVKHKGEIKDRSKFDDIIIPKDFLISKSDEEKENLVSFIFGEYRKLGFIYPSNSSDLLNDFNALKERQVNLNTNVLDNTNKASINICKYFCHSFYSSNFLRSQSIIDCFSNNECLNKSIRNKLGLLKDKPTYHFTMRSIIGEMLRTRLCHPVSIFKPLIAKYMCLKYSNEGDVVGDYSAGFGGRLLGAMSCNRKYIGTDPLTGVELQNMINFFEFKDCKVLPLMSENYRGEENSVDLYWASPPYYDLEKYSDAISQAYNKGEYYFYNKYWARTLENIKYMLKPGKWFGLNVSENYPQMIDMAKQQFGDVVETVCLRSLSQKKSKSDNPEDKFKNEYIYMFKNNK